jgi:hypothetical protein
MLLNHGVNKLLDQFSNHVGAVCDAIAYFLEQHPNLEQEDRATLLHLLQFNAVKLMDLAQRLDEQGSAATRAGK